uniref:Rab-GAP TBC domain-containing protein n=1 Tax=Sparus aurata TaxID=8175 RepID=A0A671XA41_SPAAU
MFQPFQMKRAPRLPGPVSFFCGQPGGPSIRGYSCADPVGARAPTDNVEHPLRSSCARYQLLSSLCRYRKILAGPADVELHLHQQPAGPVPKPQHRPPTDVDSPRDCSKLREFLCLKLIKTHLRKQRSVSHSVAGWKLFGKVPPKQSPSKQARIIQQVVARGSPTHHAAGQQIRRKVEFEPLSTTALILEDRPPNLPAKSAEETQRHRLQYEEMVAGAKKRELKEAQRRQQQMKERVRQEEEISTAALVWNQNILPHWDTMRSSRRARDLWWGGLPPSVRGRVWSLVIGNELNITAELYEIFASRAKEKWRSLSETETDDGPDSESSLELVSRDVSRTFPSLCVFQKGGPYHDVLQSILGAYTCYRPDVGYVQGMSFMAAMLVLNMDEVEAFISFSNLINRPCQLAFYRVHHQLMFRYFGAFQMFFEETLPRLFLHFQSSGVTPDLYLMDWILSLYTKPLPLDVACRVWDVFFRDGEEFLFRTALGILRLYQDVLLHMDLISIGEQTPHLWSPHSVCSQSASRKKQITQADKNTCNITNDINTTLERKK